MKICLSLLFYVLLLGCTNSIYHVASVESEQVKPVDSDFVFENEHLRVVYNLWEEGGRMRFALYNKTDQPLYIDWSKSVMVRNDSITAYTQLPPLPKKGFTDIAHYTYQNAVMQPFRMTARANRLTEIPAQRFVAIADFPIRQVLLHAKTKEKLFTYTKENSPLRVGQRLAYSFDKSLTDAHLIEHSFWVNKIQVLQDGEMTRLYGPLWKGQPNSLYVAEKPPVSAATIVFVTAASVVGSVLALSNMSFGAGMGKWW